MIMDYKEKLRLAKEALESGSYDKDTIEYIFPELAESEDEKIRKEIISHLKYLGKYCQESMPNVNEWIAWLEKQGKQRANLIDIDAMVLKYSNTREKETNGLPVNCQIRSYRQGINDTLNLSLNIEKQGEHKPAYKVEPKFKVKYAGCEYNVLEVKDIVGVTYYGIEDEPNHIDYVKADNCKIISGGYGIKENGSPYPTKTAVFSEQKPNNKVEPKFKVGDWVVTSYGKVNQVVSVDKDGDGYTLDDGMYFSGSWYDVYHLWTIQDAKDGDVLVNGSNIFIFHFINDTRLMGYCHVNTDDGRFYDDIGKNECFCLIDAVVNPATKEQRDTLFLKMKEAGYEWSEETHELKKISQRMVSAEAKEALYDKPTDEEMKELLRTEYEKGRADAIAEMKSSWSEKDEKVIAIINNALTESNTPPDDYDKVYDWLESLRKRIGE